jgi:SHS family sialic acid transporter-like MFS transporter
MTTASEEHGKLTRGHWLVLAAALLGWMFDGAEQGLFPIVARPAIGNLLGYPEQTTEDQEHVIALWIGVVTACYLVGAATGGVLFGWLGDRIGRVRAMTLSVFTYAVFTGLCGVVPWPAAFGVLRFIASLGMGGEWALGVALVMEVWPNRSRALMAGLIGAASNVGYLLDSFIERGIGHNLEPLKNWLIQVGFSAELTEALTARGGWRLLMLTGTAPALLTLLIRLFVPESERWQHERGRGGTAHWATKDLLGVLLGSLGPGLMILLWVGDYAILWRVAGSLGGIAVAILGYSYPVFRYLQREAVFSGRAAGEAKQTIGRMLLAAALAGTALLGTWAAAQWAPTWADKLSHQLPGARSQTQMWSAIGAIVGTIAAALVGGWLGRRVTYAFLCVSSIGSLIWLFQLTPEFGSQFLFASFVVGLCTASFYGWLPLYLPELFRTGVRATCQGFGFNFGRILAAIGALQMGNLVKHFSLDVTIAGVTLRGGYPLACTLMTLIYLFGLVLIWFAPETRGRPLPE